MRLGKRSLLQRWFLLWKLLLRKNKCSCSVSCCCWLSWHRKTCENWKHQAKKSNWCSNQVQLKSVMPNKRQSAQLELCQTTQQHKLSFPGRASHIKLQKLKNTAVTAEPVQGLTPCASTSNYRDLVQGAEPAKPKPFFFYIQAPRNGQFSGMSLGGRGKQWFPSDPSCQLNGTPSSCSSLFLGHPSSCLSCHISALICPTSR